MSNTLPDPLPADPLPLVRAWLDEARERRITPNPDALYLATHDSSGYPAVRTVLCKAFDVAAGYLVLYTNYRSEKGRQLDADPRAAAMFHWDALGRQVRFVGEVSRSPAEESDAYFASRHRGSRIGAWASAQSEPIGSREALLARVRECQERFGATGPVPRPPHWGGYRLWIARVELWVDGPDRVHDRARWERELGSTEDGRFDAQAWRAAVRLQP